MNHFWFPFDVGGSAIHEWVTNKRIRAGIRVFVVIIRGWFSANFILLFPRTFQRSVPSTGGGRRCIHHRRGAGRSGQRSGRGRGSRRKRSRSFSLFFLSMAGDFCDFSKNREDVDWRTGRDFILPNVNMMRKVFKFGEVRGIIPAAKGIIVFV